MTQSIHYVVTSGEFGDFTIYGVYDNEEADAAWTDADPDRADCTVQVWQGNTCIGYADSYEPEEVDMTEWVQIHNDQTRVMGYVMGREYP